MQIDKLDPSTIRFLLNNILRCLMAKYKVFIEEDEIDVSKVFQDKLQSPRSGFQKEFLKDLERLNRSINEVQGILVNINSFLKQKPPFPPGLAEKTKTQLVDIFQLSLGLNTIEVPSDAMEIRQLLAQVESQHLEFKSSMRWDIKEGRLNKELTNAIAKTIAGFMNSEGGTLLIGVDDHGNVLGLEKDFATFGGQDIRQKRISLKERLIKQFLTC